MQKQEHGLLQGNNNLQQLDVMEQPGNETRAPVEALTELLKLSEARLQGLQQVLQTMKHTRAYRLLHRLGRWRFMEQGLSELPPGSSWRTGDSSSPDLHLPITQTLSAYKTALDALHAAQPNTDMLDRIRSHNHFVVDEMHAIRSLKGRVLLDLGASAWGYALERALEQGAALYVGIDLEVAKSQYVLGDCGSVGLLLHMDAASLQLPAEMFDLVISTSTFEHFVSIDVVLSEIERVLKAGGLALIAFDDVWSCSYGHHLLHFGDCANLVPPWAHLIWTAEQMLQALAKTWPESAPLSAERAVEWIYNDPERNRLSIRHIRKCLDHCSLDVKWMVEHKEEGVDQTALQNAAVITGLSSDELITRGMSVLLEKRADDLSSQQQVDQPADFDACYAQVREPKQRQGVAYTPGAEDRIIQQLRLLGWQVRNYEIDVEDYRRYFVAARYVEDFPHYYPTNLAEKSLEHYLAAHLLQLNAQDIYIDIASEHSPVPEIYRHLFATTTYRQDLAYPLGLHDDKIGGDAAHMPLPAEFATKIALHCSFEHFEGDSDIGFIRETARVLRPGGAACIVPLYLFEEYAIQTDPVVAVPAGVVFDEEVTVYCAQGWNNRYGRFYSPAQFASRVGENLSGLQVEMYRFTNVQQVDASCYVRFAILLKKPKIR